MRILVVGIMGGGKSTFARKLADATGLPLIHLDKHYWQKNWVRVPAEKWVPLIDKFLARHDWIMDGNYLNTLSRRLAHADAVIVFDIPRYISLWRALHRTLSANGDAFDKRKGVRERFTLSLLKKILFYPREEIFRKIKESGVRDVVIVHDDEDAKKALLHVSESMRSRASRVY